MAKDNIQDDTFNDAFLTYVAELYFSRELLQTDIAAKLGVSKMTVSRSLKRATEKGIVDFSIRRPITTDSKLSNRLESKFPGILITVLKNHSVKEQSSDHIVGAAFALQFGLRDIQKKTVGVGIGSTVASFVHELIPIVSPQTTVVQLIGGLPEVGFANPFTILNELVTKLQAEGVYFTTNVLVESKEARDALFDIQAHPGGAVAQWQQLDSAIFGIGCIKRGNLHELLLNPRLVRPNESEELLNTPAVAEILGHCLDPDGKIVDTRLEERIASIPLNVLVQVKDRVALAGGSDKATAIIATLRSGFLTELVTDSSAAVAILNLL